MHRRIRILSWLNIGVMLAYLMGVQSVAVAQKGSIQEAETLNQQAIDLNQQGRYEEAIPRAQRALAIAEKTLGPEHPGTATALNNLAELYRVSGAYGKAEPLYQRALAIAESVLGAEHPSTASLLNNLALLDQSIGAYGQAELLFQRALAIAEKALGPEHPDTAQSLNNLAGLYLRTGAYGQAEALSKRALAIYEKTLGPKHLDTAQALNNLAGLYLSIGAYGRAEPLYQRAQAIYEKALGSENPNTALSLNNLAELYQRTGAYGRAEPLFQRALAIYEKALGPENPNTALSLNNLAGLYERTGAYGRAEPLSKRALAIYEKTLGPEHPDTASSLNNLAGLYLRTGAYGRAEPLYQRALTIAEKVLGPEHPDTAGSLNNLAEFYESIGAYGQAEPLYQRALTIAEKVLGLEHPNTAQALNNLAGLYLSTGAYAEAGPLYKRALVIDERALGPGHPDTAQALNGLARLYLSTGAYAEAEPLYERALAIYEKALGTEHPDTAKALNNLGMFYWASGDLSRALLVHSRAQSIEEKNLSTFFLAGSESRKQAYLAQVRGDTFGDISLSLLMSDSHANALGFQSVLMTKGRVLDAMATSTVRLRESVKQEDRTIMDELITVAQQRSSLTYQGIGSLKPEVYRQRLQELVARQEQLETDLSSRSAEFHQTVVPVTLAALQAVIPKGAALTEWYRYSPFNPKAKDQQSRWGKPRYVAFVVRHEGEPVAFDVGEAESIDQLVHDFRTGLGDRTSTYVRDVAKDLYAKLYKPLQQHLENAHPLILSPDGALNLVPFAALIDESGTYLGAKKNITYLTSGRDLLRHQRRAVARAKAIVVANPSYGKASTVVGRADPSNGQRRSADLDRGGKDFRPLPGTAKEARALKTLLNIGEDQVVMEGKASESRIKRLHSPHILHVATHGFFLADKELPTPKLSQGSFYQDEPHVSIGENPLLRSGLALAGANSRRSEEKEDGILTAAEVAQMDLRGTQLVVLSACETGVGDVQNGEGVYGLRRALVLAGAESQVTSLWKVADEATKDLMVDYYQRLLKGEGRSEALRHAQLAMMKSKDRSHPYYWAAFVPIGDWRPLERNK